MEIENPYNEAMRYIENARDEIRKIFDETTDRDLDLIILNDSDLIITMQAIANGKLIVNTDKSFFNIWKALKIGMYIDFKQSRRIIDEDLLLNLGIRRK